MFAPAQRADDDKALRAAAEGLWVGFGKLLRPVRAAVTGTTGTTVSPPLFGTLVLIGRERTLVRLTTTKALIARD